MIYKFLVLAYIIEYFRPQQYLPILGTIKITTLLPLAVIGASLIAKSGKDRTSNGMVLQHRNTRVLLFFLALLMLHFLLAIIDDTKVAIYAFDKLETAFAFFLLFFATAKEVNSIDKMKGVFVGLLVAHLLIIVLNPDIVTQPEVRSYLNHAYLGDGNDFALSLCILVPMCLFLILDSKSKLAKLLAIAATLVVLIGIVGTSSRGGTLALVCILLYQWWRGRRKFAGILIGLVILTVVMVYAPPYYFERIHTISEYETEGSAQGRLTAWKAAMRMAVDYPLIGVGPGHFPVAFGTTYFPRDATGPMPWLTAHSIYFLALGELGFPGLIFIMFVIYGTLWRSDQTVKLYRSANGENEKRVRHINLCMTSSLLAYAVAGAFLSALYYPHIFVLLALYVAMDQACKREMNLEDRSRGTGVETSGIANKDHSSRRHRV